MLKQMIIVHKKGVFVSMVPDYVTTGKWTTIVDDIPQSVEIELNKIYTEKKPEHFVLFEDTPMFTVQVNYV